MSALLLVAVSLVGQIQWYKSPYQLSDGAMGYHFSDPTTQVHEDTHGVNSLLRQRYGGECFYVGHGRFVRFKRLTAFRLRDVASRCKYRGTIFRLYLQEQQAYWDDQPLYLFDEWVAYTNGAEEAMARPGLDGGSDITFSLEMGYYASVAVDLLPASYPDSAQVRAFWLWNARRTVRLAEQAQSTGRNYRAAQTPWRRWMAARIAAQSH